MKKIKLTTVLELSKKLNCSKTKLLYYKKIGIITPINVLGKLGIYDEHETLKRIKAASNGSRKGKTLSWVKNNKINENRRQRKNNKLPGQPTRRGVVDSRNKKKSLSVSKKGG